MSHIRLIDIPERHCQNGRDSVCLAANFGDNVVCPHDSCDIDDDVRSDPRLGQVWTESQKIEFKRVLAEIFGWKNQEE